MLNDIHAFVYKKKQLMCQNSIIECESTKKKR